MSDKVLDRSRSPRRAASEPCHSLEKPVFIATWPFGQLATAAANKVLLAGGSVLDAVEKGVNEVERQNCDGSVGIGGRPNSAGYTQVDACIMNGDDHQAGSVAGVEGIVHAVSLARLVMDKTRHVMLVGEGARWLALDHGLESIDISDLPAKKANYQARQKKNQGGHGGHDTITLLGIDNDGHIAGACSTSGAANKLPGRVGDSPIVGSGLYVDKEVGAAGATGLGENIMRRCIAFQCVALMAQGMSPLTACQETIHQVARKEGTYELDICIIAVNREGNVGAAASNQTFQFAVCVDNISEVKEVADTREQHQRMDISMWCSPIPWIQEVL